MKRLMDIGFLKIGYWYLDESNNLDFKLNSMERDINVLYTFIVDGDVKYIGKTIQPLVNRIKGYQKPGPTQSTNQKNYQLITEMLIRGCKVDIYALSQGLLNYGEFKINLAAGLEDDLIEKLRPEWNKISMKSKPDKRKIDGRKIVAPRAITIKSKDYFKSRLPHFLNDWISLTSGLSGKEWIEERKKTYNLYRSKFHPNELANLTENDFSFFLMFRGNLSWTNMSRSCKRLIHDMEGLRENINFLQNESIPIQQRLNRVMRKGDRHLKGFGKNLVTGILHIIDWHQYGVWNNVSIKCLKALGLLPRLSTNLGESYILFNAELKKLADYVDIDLVTLDGYFWWFLKSRKKN